MIHSGGGLVSVETAAEFPVRLVESGPAGGAIFAADIARRFGLDRVVSYDMGGTTAKICLIENAQPRTARTFEVARTYRFAKGSGMPISIPVIEMIEIGAGGGSIASIDAMGRIQTGPESAGSEPGPACYQRGGTRPAITDADLVLGKIDAENFAGGAIRLSSTRPRTPSRPMSARRSGSRLWRPRSASSRSWTRTWPTPRACMRSRTARTSRTM
jgi:N-methylhydantoinase A